MRSIGFCAICISGIYHTRIYSVNRNLYLFYCSLMYTAVQLSSLPLLVVTVQIKDTCEVLSGYQARAAVEPEANGSHFLLQIRDFDSNRRDIKRGEIVRFSASLSQKITTLKEGDVVFLARGAKNFAAVVRDLPSPCLASPYFFILRPNQTIQPDYLAWLLNQPDSLKYFVKFATTGAHMPIVRRDVLEEMVVPVPSLATQKRIVEVDTLAQRQQTLLAELAEKKQLLATAICNQAAAGKLPLN